MATTVKIFVLVSLVKPKLATYVYFVCWCVTSVKQTWQPLFTMLVGVSLCLTKLETTEYNVCLSLALTKVGNDSIQFCWYVFGVKQSWQRLYTMLIGVLPVLHEVDNDRKLCVCVCVCVCV